MALAAVWALLLPAAATALAEGPSNPADYTEEMLLFAEIPSVYSASKYEQKVTEAPSSVSIVTASEIRKLGYRTLTDVLRSIRGFSVTNDRNYEYVGVRGFGRPADYNSRVLVLVDGHRINDNIYDGALMGMDFVLDVDLIDRVEVIRGPSSSLYGTSAFFGVINVITRRGRDIKGLQISGEAGSKETWKGRASFGYRFQDGLEMIFSGTGYGSQGRERLFFKEFEEPALNNGVAEDLDEEGARSLFATLGWKDFVLQGAYVTRDKEMPAAPWGTAFNREPNDTEDSRAYIDLKYDRALDSGLEAMARVYCDWYRYHGRYSYTWEEEDGLYQVVNYDGSEGRWWGSEVKFTKPAGERNRLTLGGEYRRHHQQDQKNYDIEDYLDDRRDSEDWGLYLQNELKIRENLILNMGIRHDHYDTFGGTTNPRLALIYNPLEKTTLKLLYGRAFRAPNTYEAYYQDGGISTKANPDLDPEVIRTCEIVLEQYVGERLRLTASGFYYEIEDLISQQLDPEDGLLMYGNIEKIDATGIEMEMEAKWPCGTEGRLSYTFQETEEQRTGRILTNSPKHLAKFTLILPLLKDRIFLGTEIQYTGRRKTLTRNETEDFFVTNATLFSRNILEELELSASVYNMFDKKYGDPGAGEHAQDILTQDGRTFRFKLTYTF